MTPDLKCSVYKDKNWMDEDTSDVMQTANVSKEAATDGAAPSTSAFQLARVLLAIATRRRATQPWRCQWLFCLLCCQGLCLWRLRYRLCCHVRCLLKPCGARRRHTVLKSFSLRSTPAFAPLEDPTGVPPTCSALPL